MGFELDRLMQRYGVSTPVMATYSGSQSPGNYADVVDVNAVGGIAPAQGKMTPAQYDARLRQFTNDLNAYNTYTQEYQRRLGSTPMYLEQQYQAGTPTTPSAVTFSAAQRAAMAPGGIGQEAMNRNVQDWFAKNPHATPAEIRSAQTEWGVSDLDIRNAMGLRPERSTAYRYANAPGGIGMDAMNSNIRKYFADNPLASREATEAEQKKWGVSNEDIYRATGSYWGSPLRAPTYSTTPKPGELAGGLQIAPEVRALTEAQKIDLYRSLRAQGYSDAQIRAQVESSIGPQTDTDWRYLVGKAYPAAWASGLPSGFTGQTAADKIRYYNEKGITPTQLFAADPTLTQEGLNWMLTQGGYRPPGYVPPPTPAPAPAAPTPAPLTPAPARDVSSILPSEWGTLNAAQKIDWYNRNNITPSELLKAGVTQPEIDWMIAQPNGYMSGVTPPVTPAPGSPPIIVPNPNWIEDSVGYVPPAASPAPAPAPITQPSVTTPATPPSRTTLDAAAAAGVNLPSDWSSITSPAQKIAWFNQQSITPQQLASSGVPQSDIDWMRLNGYVVADPAYDTSDWNRYARGGAVEAKRFGTGGLNEADQREDFAGLAERYGAQLPAEPTQLGAAQPLVSPAAEQPVSLDAMLAKYLQPTASGMNYGQELAAARKTAQAETEAFQRLLQQAIAQPEQPPSKSELYFRLAAAFAEPGKTGSFGEGLGRAAGAVAEQKKAEREAAKASAAQKLQLGLTAQQAKMQAAKEDVGTLRGLAAEDEKSRRAVTSELLKEWVKKNDPVSTAGKQAQDEGLRPGTPEFQRRVKEISELNIEKQMATINAAVAQMSVAAGTLSLRQQAEVRAQEASKKLTPAEVKLKTETEDTLAAADSAIGMLERAYALNPNTFDASLPDLAQRKVLEAAGSKDKKLLNTRELENLLGEQALAKLKATFGGAPTEGERQALLDLQGLGAKSIQERAQIMKNIFRVLRDNRARQRKRLNDINAGLYRDVSGQQPSPLE